MNDQTFHSPGSGTDLDYLTAFAESGDEAAFAKLVERYAPLVYGVALRKTRHRQNAEEISQAVFLILARKAASLTTVRSLAAWLHRVTALESLKNLRQSATRDRHLVMIKENVGHEQALREQPDRWKEIAPEIDEALGRLSMLDRDVLMLHYFEELPFKEVAKRVATTPEAAQKRSVRALEKLARFLKRRGVAVPAATLGAGLFAQLASSVPKDFGQALPSAVLHQLASVPAGSASAAPSLLSIMTVSKLTISTVTAFVLAAALPVTWQAFSSNSPASMRDGTSKGPRSPVAIGAQRSNQMPENVAALDLKALERELRRLVQSEEPDPAAERALRRLMFTLDVEEISPVIRLLEQIAKPERIHEIMLAAFSRWAEFDPRSATIKAAGYPPAGKGSYPLRGAFVTWAMSDPEAAEAWLLSADTAFHEELLAFGAIDYLARQDPERGLAAAQRWAQAKPDWNGSGLVQRALNSWITQDSKAAMAWIAEEPSEVKRDQWMGDALEALGGREPRLAMNSLDQIMNLERREEVMWNVYWGWMMRTPTAIEYFTEVNGAETWPLHLVQGVGDALARSFPDSALRQAKEIEDLKRRDRFLSGVLSGLAWSDPAKGTEAAELISEQQAVSDGSLTSFVSNWAKRDAAAAAEWIASLPESRRKDWAASQFENHTGQSLTAFAKPSSP